MKQMFFLFSKMNRWSERLVHARARAPEPQPQLCCVLGHQVKGWALCLQGACCLIGSIHPLPVFKYHSWGPAMDGCSWLREAIQ